MLASPRAKARAGLRPSQHPAPLVGEQGTRRQERRNCAATFLDFMLSHELGTEGIIVHIPTKGKNSRQFDRMEKMTQLADLSQTILHTSLLSAHHQCPPEIHRQMTPGPPLQRQVNPHCNKEPREACLLHQPLNPCQITQVHRDNPPVLPTQGPGGVMQPDPALMSFTLAGRVARTQPTLSNARGTVTGEGTSQHR